LKTGFADALRGFLLEENTKIPIDSLFLPICLAVSPKQLFLQLGTLVIFGFTYENIAVCV